MKEKKFRLVIIGSFVGFLLLTQVNCAIGASVLTDTTDDITNITWTSATVYDVDNDQTLDKIDIKSVDYAVLASGNHTITLNLEGTPVLDDKTFYWIAVTDTDFNLIIWAGGFTGYTESIPAMMTLSSGTIVAMMIVLTPDISGKAIIFNIPQEAANMGFGDPVDLDLPDEAPSTWEWQIMTWSADVAYGTYSGTWSMDYYPNEDNVYDTEEPAASPGFELFVIVTAIVSVYYYHRRRK